jgi:two-component system response regulator RegA
MSDETQILVIDDDPAFNRVLSRALKGRGFTVASAHSAEEAAALIPATHAARAVLDLNIGGTSGLTLSRRCSPPTPTAASSC